MGFLARRRTLESRRLRPRVDFLEVRTLLSKSALTAAPTFVLASPDVNSTPPSGAFAPAQIQVAYGFNDINFGGTTGDGSGETIAIVDAFNDPNIQADLNAFDSEYALPSTTVTVVDQSGGMSYPKADSTGGWELEESLDVEWAHAMAPGASLLLVEANSDNDDDLFTAVNYAAAHANVVSMSFAGDEYAGEIADDSADFAKAGVAFVAASGDTGAPANYPAASPNVLSVGGTALTLGPGNAWSSEVGWSGSTGGLSVYESQPTYQKGVVTQTSTQRATPDVAYDSSPSTGFAVYDSVAYNGTTYDWIKVGGTSAGAPQWAALLAIADQGRALAGEPALDSTNPQEVMDILYNNPDDFRDITSGTSTGAPEYIAGVGYDYVTGLGTPIANLVVNSLENPLSDKLVLAAPSTVTAGASFKLTVSAEYSTGKADASYRGTVQFSSSDVQAGLPADFTFTAADHGTYTFSISLKTAGTASITATDIANSTITGTLGGETVDPGAVSQFVLSGVPSTTTAGVAQTVLVEAEDSYGNLATNFSGTVQFNSTDTRATLPATFTFTAVIAGLYDFPFTFKTAGLQSVTVTDPTSGISATLSSILVQPGAAQTLSVAGFPAQATAGVPADVTVTALDAFGNVATGYTGVLSLASSDNHASFSPSDSLVPGERNFVATLVTAGLQTITATDTSVPALTATESNINVAPAMAAMLKVTGFPSLVVAGAPDDVVVTAYDAYGNVATGYAGIVSLTSSDPSFAQEQYAFGPSDAGSQSVGVTLDSAGAQSITAADTNDPSITGVESGILVEPGPAAILDLEEPTNSLTAGAPADITVIARDEYGNVATGYRGDVEFTSTDPRALLPSAFAFGASDQGIDSVAVTLETAGPQSITVSDEALPSLTATASNLTVQAAAAQTLMVVGFPTVVMAGEANPVTVTAYDPFGNVAVGYAGTIEFESSDSQALLPDPFPFMPADLGVATFFVTLKTAGDQSISATDTLTPSIAGVESGITVRAIPRITWSAPDSIVYGTALGSEQLAASANVAGTFTYTPAAGVILGAGSGQALGLLFTPANTTYYTTATASQTIVVDKAAPTVDVTDKGGGFDGMAFPASATVTGELAGIDDTPAASLEGVMPSLTYFVGKGIGGPSLGSTAPSNPGVYTVVATFPGSANYAAAASAPTTFTIAQAASSVNLVSSIGAVVFGQPVTFAARVSALAGTLTGTVTFSDGINELATVALNATGTASFTTSALAVGLHSITATFSGATDFLGIQSSLAPVTVAQTGTGLVMTENLILNKKRRATAVRLVAEVDPTAPGGGVPTGEVTFERLTKIKKKIKVTTLGRAVVSGGEATITLKAGMVLGKAITVIYGGDANDKTSTTTTVKVT